MSGHHHTAVSHLDSLGLEMSELAGLAPGHQAPVCRNNTPPGDFTTMATKNRADRSGGAWFSDFGGDFTVRNDLAGHERVNDGQHEGFEFGELAHAGTSARISIGSSNPGMLTGPIATVSVLTIRADTNSFGARS